MKRVLFFIQMVVAMLMMACDDYDRWTTSPNVGLSFSADTLHFDTVITGMSSSTQTLVAFNRGDEGLRRIRVNLKNGSESRFRVNVDGQYLYEGSGSDFEIRRRDSLVVRAEVMLPDMGDAEIRHYEDRLIFTLESGVQQEIILQADGMNVKIVHGKVVETDETLTAGMPYLFYDSLVVKQGATLTLEPGAKLLFHDHVSMDVHGTLKAIGTREMPITLRGDRMDRMFAYLPYDNTPNRWGGIHFYGESCDNMLEYCDIHSGDFGIVCDSSHFANPFMPILSMWNSAIHNIGGQGLALRSTKAEVVGCQISNCLENCVDILGGNVFMLHCTIAQFYSFAVYGKDALYLANLDAEGNYVPISQAYFVNCLITGFADDVVMGNLAPENDEPCNYLFDHCFLRTVRSEDEERFVECNYDDAEGPEAMTCEAHFALFDKHDFLYDFSPWQTSPIATTGRADYTLEFLPEDCRGRIFPIVEGKSPCGAYAPVPIPKE